MVKCSLCHKKKQSGCGSFFRVPCNESLRQRWVSSCRVELKRNDFICSEHFNRSHMICGGQRSKLLPKALPLPFENPVVETSADTNNTMPPAAAIPLQISNIGVVQEPLQKPILYIQTPYTTYNMDKEAVSPKYQSKSIQTDGIFGNRVSCGWVKTSPTELHRTFHLTCFYCDAEYPISLWSEFSDHILSCHELEQFYNDEPYFNSTASDDEIYIEQNVISKKAVENEHSATDVINDDKNECSILENSNLNVSSQRTANEETMDDNEPVDQINFDATPHNIVTDLLTNLKGFPNLWDDSNLNLEKHDKELSNLMDIMKLKWDLNLKKNHFKENLKDIKTWFFNIREASVKNGHCTLESDKLRECYEYCAEFLPFGLLNKYKFPCDLCNSVFASPTQLQTHKSRQHLVGKLPFSCNKCNKQYGLIDNLYKHLVKHTLKKQIVQEEKNDFLCYVCNRNFTCSNEYKIHLDLHPHGNRQFTCDECERRFKDIYSKNAHQKQHKQTTGFQCELCPLKLKTAATFRHHMKTHEGNYDYVCEFCGKAFVCRDDWTEHRKFAHMGHGICKICNREYKKRSILLTHLRSLHRPTFGTIEELTRRNRTFERSKINLKARKFEYIYDPATQRNRLKCPVCDKTFLQHRNVGEHAFKVHNFDIRTMKRGIPAGRSQEQQRASHSETINENIAEEENETAEEPISECSDAIVETPNYETNNNNAIIEANEVADIDTNLTASTFPIPTNMSFSYSTPSNFLGGMYVPPMLQMVAPLMPKPDGCENKEYNFILNTGGTIINFADY